MTVSTTGWQVTEGRRQFMTGGWKSNGSWGLIGRLCFSGINIYEGVQGGPTKGRFSELIFPQPICGSRFSLGGWVSEPAGPPLHSCQQSLRIAATNVSEVQDLLLSLVSIKCD